MTNNYSLFEKTRSLVTVRYINKFYGFYYSSFISKIILLLSDYKNVFKFKWVYSIYNQDWP